MATLSNREGNTKLRVCLNGIEEKGKTEFETWINCELEIVSNVFNCALGNQDDLTLNKYELDFFLNNLNEMLNCLENQREYSFSFSNCESNFEVRMSTVIEDAAVEIEIWINWGNYTCGKEYGYDAGIRFVSDVTALQLFIRSVNDEKNGLF